MGGRVALAALALTLSACLDPIVGTRCATGYEPCRGACKAIGSCDAIDGSPGLQTDAPDSGGAIDGEGRDGQAEPDGPMVAGIDGDTLDQTANDASATDATGATSDDADAADAAAEAEAGLAGDAPPISPAGDGPQGSDAPGDDGCSCVDIPISGDSDEDDLGSDDAVAGDDLAPPSTSDDADDGGPDDDTGLECPEPGLACNGQCVDPALDPENCGDCNVICATGVCNEGVCLVCEPDQSVCGRACINTSIDPDNCGGCYVPCASGLCSNGQCEAAGTGRAIVIGHDYLKNRPAMNRVLGNAVFLWPVNPVRLLVYQGAANPVAVVGAEGAIAQVASATGRQYVRTSANTADVPALLPSADVFLIYGQEQADDATLLQLGNDWAYALGVFVARGGSVVLLDGAYPANAGTSQILAQANLFLVARDVSVTGDVCSIVARGDALATGLPRTYLCEKNSTSLVVTDPGIVTPVVADVDKLVVVHKVF